MAIDLFIAAGQSNSKGQGNSAQSPTPPADKAKEYRSDGSVVALDDPVEGGQQDPIPEAETGSLWPAFADEYISQTGRDLCIVGNAVDATAQSSEADNGSGNWSDGSVVYTDAVDKSKSAFSALTDPRHAGVVWLQGETDAGAINNGTITKSDYKTAFENMISRWRSDLDEPNLPFWVLEVGNRNNNDLAGYQTVRAAQQEVVRADDDVCMVSDIQKSFHAGRFNGDGLEVHYNQGAYNEAGRLAAKNVSYHMEA